MNRNITFLVLLFSFAGFSQEAGTLDPTFGAGGFVITNDLQTGSNIAVMPDNRIVMVGGISDFNIVRFMPDGMPDNSFGINGIATVDFGNENDYAYDVAVQTDGKILIVGVIDGDPATDDQAVGVARLNADGTLDTTFNGTGKLVFDFDATTNYPNAIALQSDGKIVVAGYTGWYATDDFAVARLNPDGSFDTDFGTGGKQRINIQGDDRGRCVAIQPDGKIVLGGLSYPVGVNTCGFAAVRLLPDGTPDMTFSGDGKVLAKIGGGNDSVYDMALQPDGKILLAADSYLSSQQIGVVRFTAVGELDTTFSGDGKFNSTFGGTSSDYVNAIAVQPDGKILVAGSFYNPAIRNIGLIRMTETGDLDTTFSADGKAAFEAPGNNGVTVYDMKLQSTGQILVSGYAQSDFMLARIFSGNEILATPHWNENANTFWPNPASQTVNFNEDVRSVAVFAIDGKRVLEQTVPGNRLDVSGLPKGIYLLRMFSGSCGISESKLVVE